MKNYFRKTLAIVTPLLILAVLPVAAQSPVVQIDHVKVDAAFAKGMPLLETNAFKIHASRRGAPGLAEIHTRDTDIVYVLEGAATLVTGGKALEARTIAPDEVRGKAIEGGETRRIIKGDVVVIPNGVPHWFKKVDGPLRYYVVKVTN